MTFGQGHGFATGGIQYSAGAGRNSNEEMMRNLLVQRRDASGATGADQAKREYSSYSTNSAFAGSQTGAFPAAGSLAASGAFPTGPPSNYSLSSFSGEEKRGKKKTKRHKHNNASSSSGGTNLNLGDVDPMGTAARFGSAGGAGYGQAGGLYTGGMHGGGGYRGGW
jgi:CCR4-NOT transcription complex subunit 4